MFNKQSHLQLFFPEPMDDLDWSNLKLSKIKRVQLFLNNCRVSKPDGTIGASPQFLQLASSKYKITIRISQDDVEQLPASYLRLQIQPLISYKAVEAIILGNEPEHEYDLTWASRNWGNKPEEKYPSGAVWRHSSKINQLIDLLAQFPVKLISPGWSMRSISEDDLPQPGQVMWSDVCRPVYNLLQGNGVHYYGYDTLSEVDCQRFKWSIKRYQELFHKPLWINEINFNNPKRAELSKIAGIINLCRILEDPKFGERIENLCPFVSNGDAKTWDANYLIRSTESYQLLRDYLSGV